MFEIKVVEKIGTCILSSITPPPPENHAVYEIVWKNIVEPDGPQRPIWRMCFTCWMNKAMYIYIYYIYRVYHDFRA
jgi:hypothetical protein